MQKALIFRILSCLLVLLMGIQLAPQAAVSGYRVGPGDQLFIDFPLRGSPSDLQALNGNGLTLVIVGESVYFRYEAVVAPDGFISLPSMDPLQVTGLTLEGVRDLISSHFKSLSLSTHLSVSLGRASSSAFVVTGQVQHPGRFVYERPTSLMEALALAGGTTDHAQLKSVMLFRSGQSPLSIDLSDKELRQSGPPALAILPSDMIVVPRRWFTPDNLIVLIFLSAVTTAATVYAATK